MSDQNNDTKTSPSIPLWMVAEIIARNKFETRVAMLSNYVELEEKAAMMTSEVKK